MNPTTQYRPAFAILVGGGIAATNDIVYAVLRNWGNGSPPLRTLQSVASGWLGKGAFDSGVNGGMLGLVSHYAILFIAAWIYFSASQRFAVLRTRPLLCGAVFGVLVYLFMNFVVIPFSAAPFHITYTPLKLLEGFASHAVFVGLPIALAVNKWTTRVITA
jgi:uncharacterized membrane protein YagU involved in acid resistance